MDGSAGEGGGQILRTAVAFSAIQGRSVRVTRIRAGRDVPGLRQQHVSALQVLAKVFGGELNGAAVGSSAIEFVPGNASLGSLSVGMGTAASITLVLQAVVPAVSLAGRSLRLELAGGTDVPWSPTFDYFALVVREAFKRVGIPFDARAGRRGYYPRGGGTVVTDVAPCPSVQPLNLISRKELPGAGLTSRCGGLPGHVAERQLRGAREVLEGAGVKVLNADTSVEMADSPGSSVLVSSSGAGYFLGADSIGAKGKPAEVVGRDAASRFLAEAQSGACLDSNLADMVIPLLSLARSPSAVRTSSLTSHLKSGMEIASLFTACAWSVVVQAGGAVVRVTPRAGP